MKLRTHIIILLFASTTLYAAPKSVLYISSYHQSMKWNRELFQGLDSVLNQSTIDISLYVENMDTKRNRYSDEYGYQLFESYKKKYGSIKFDLIITSDNNALSFLNSYHDSLFLDIPVVFSGINNFNNSLVSDRSLFTGVVEEGSICDNINLLTSLSPRTKEILVINDFLPTGILAKKEIIRGFGTSDINKKINIIYSENIPFDSLIHQVEKLPPYTVILLGVYYQDSNGKFYTEKEVASRLSIAAYQPIFGLVDFYMGYGVLGGKLITAYSQGKTAGEICLRVLAGEKPSDIPIVKSESNEFIFDYKKLKAFNIPIEQLPNDSHIINGTPSIFRRYRSIITISSLAFILLVILIIFLITDLLIRNKKVNILIESKKNLEDRNRRKLIDLQSAKADGDRLIRTTTEILINVSKNITNSLINIRDGSGGDRNCDINSLLNTTQNVSDITLMLSDRFNLKPVIFKIQGLLKEITDFYNIEIYKNIELSFEILPNLPSSIIADKKRVLQVVNTLLSLLCNHSKSHNVKLSIKGIKDDNPKSREVGIQIILRDEDNFIPSKFTKIVIDNLFNDKNLMLSDYNDLDISLVLTSKLVDIMGGDIVINSSVDNGTTISIKLIKMQVVPNDIDLD